MAGAQDKYALSDEQIRAFQQWVQDKSQGVCQLCGKRSWEGGINIVALRIIDPNAPGNVMIGGPMYPAIPMVCANCGNMVLINAMKTGVLNQQEDRDVKK